jgi:hypothetical protein
MPLEEGVIGTQIKVNHYIKFIVNSLYSQSFDLHQIDFPSFAQENNLDFFDQTDFHLLLNLVTISEKF